MRPRNYRTNPTWRAPMVFALVAAAALVAVGG